MKRKRFVKLLMSRGYPRNVAVALCDCAYNHKAAYDTLMGNPFTEEW